MMHKRHSAGKKTINFMQSFISMSGNCREA